MVMIWGSMAFLGANAAEQKEQNGASGISAEFQEKLQVLLKEVNTNTAKRDSVINAGRDRATFCSYCHGMDGNSEQPDYPHLAGQNPVYLLEQIEKFADGRRKKPVMNALASTFTPEEKMLLAVYYALSPLKPAKADSKLAELGAPIFQSRCVACHGPDGRGEKGYARLAGQKPDYVKKTLKGFRDGTDKRQNPLMEAVTAELTDSQIDTLAAYVANLR